ncbi:MAG: MoxR family ATPase [Treponema sp.]|jgi:MoxR-like ATPase|nr:MoxR family ATPase [Treponema sp.]
MNESVKKLLDGIQKVIRGKQEFLELLTACVLAKGHVLIEDNPGLGKTTVAKTLARLIADEDGSPLVCKRIQFTPDLLPYDITGVDVFDPETRMFRFVPGPVLANIVLADEINRTTPKTQSALLEVMAERQVTIGNASYKPKEPFFVIATENPVESEGTFPLPAAQLDRFMVRLSMGYPDRDAELAILEDNPAENVLSELEPVMTRTEFLQTQADAGGVFCHQTLKEAIIDIIRATRVHENITLGASPRAGLHFLAAVKALALVRGRDFVIDEDVAILCAPALCHRLKTSRSIKSADIFPIIRRICMESLEERIA